MMKVAVILVFLGLAASQQPSGGTELITFIQQLPPDQQLLYLSNLNPEQYALISQYTSQGGDSRNNIPGIFPPGQPLPNYSPGSLPPNGLGLLAGLGSNGPLNPPAGPPGPPLGPGFPIGGGIPGSPQIFPPLPSGSLTGGIGQPTGLLGGLGGFPGGSIGGSSFEQALLQNACRNKCEDKNFICPSWSNKCDRGFLGIFIKRMCPKTCGVCAPCPLFARPCIADGSCVDRNPLCSVYYAPGKMCQDSRVGVFVRRMCPASCLECLPCPEPTAREAPCSEDCRDERQECSEWANNLNYCSRASIYEPWMKINCRLSCRECRLCVAPPGANPGARSIIPGTQTTSPPPSSRSPVFPTFFPFTTAPPTTTTPPTTTPATTTRSTTTQPPQAPMRPFNPQNPQNSQRACVRNMMESDTDVEQCIKAHNYYRCLHGVAPLSYNHSLAASAQAQADILSMPRPVGSARPSSLGFGRDETVGENIATNTQGGREFGINQAVVEWYAERFQYDYSNPGFTDETKHFTQLVWKDTTSVGCGIRRVGGNVYVVAHYHVTGNKPGEYEDNVLEMESECDGNCSMGQCYGNRRNSGCSCAASGQVPVCAGTCVISCRRPENHFGFWQTACEGRRLCSCSMGGDISQGLWPGAWCQ